MSASSVVVLCCSAFALWWFAVQPVASQQEVQMTFDLLYQYGRQAYTDQRWTECVSFLLRAMEEYKFFRNGLLLCDKRCHRQAASTNTAANRSRSFYEWHLVLHMAETSMCLLHCRNKRFSFQPLAWSRSQAEMDFENYLPYSYLQLCYWKLGDFEHAVSAAYTFLVHNPDDKMMTENLQFYSQHEKFSAVMLKDLEQPDYEKYYSDAVQRYDSEDFIGAIDIFERAVEAFLNAGEDCLRMCDRCHHAVFTNYYSLHLSECLLEVLRCQSNCTYRLSFYQGKHEPEFFSSMFNYLQLSYWRTGNLRMACEAVGTYLLFAPDDEDMLSNRELYHRKLHAQESWFKPRLDVEDFVEVYLKISSSREYLRQTFTSEIEDPTLFKANPEFQGPDELAAQNVAPKLADEAVRRQTGDPDQSQKKNVSQRESVDDLVRRHGLKVTLLSEDSGGVLVVDNLLSSEECEKILTVKDVSEDVKAQRENFGYLEMENFRTINVSVAIQMALSGAIDRTPVNIMLKKAKFLQSFLEAYYLKPKLAVESAMFVCATSKPDANLSGADFSKYDGKVLLSDSNCAFEAEAVNCTRSLGPGQRRHFNAFIFLNDNVTGGQLVLVDKEEKPSKEIASHCGQFVVLYGRALYGWKPLNADTQCILAFFFTKDSDFEEKDFQKASADWQQSFAKGHVEHDDL